MDCPNKARAPPYGERCLQPHDVHSPQPSLVPTTMALHSAHCSRVFSNITRSTCRAQLNGAVLDRYSTIRRFFRSQTFEMSPLAREHSAQNFRNGTIPRNGICDRKRWLHSYMKEIRPSTATGQVHWHLRDGDTRTLRGPTIATGLGLNIQLQPGNTRWLHASAVCRNSAKAHEEPGPSGTRPQSQRSPPDSEEPPISKQDNSQPCTCNNPKNGQGASVSPPPPPQPQPSEKLQGQPIDPTNPPKYLDNYSRFFRRLALSLPHPHRPTRDEFLSVATGFWERLKIRFKWFTIKSFRKFNADDISAFVTWFLMSQTLWILVGTCVIEMHRLTKWN